MSRKSSKRTEVLNRVKSSFIGRWRITEMEQWDQAFIDLVAPGHLTPSPGGRGLLCFGAVEATLDWRADADGKRMDFSFEGFDEGDEISGRGWAHLDGMTLTGRIFFHVGDESRFVARKSPVGKMLRRSP